MLLESVIARQEKVKEWLEYEGCEIGVARYGDVSAIRETVLDDVLETDGTTPPHKFGVLFKEGIERVLDPLDGLNQRGRLI